MKEQASIHRLKSTIIPTLQAFLSITDITEVNQSVLYNTIHRELLCNVQKRSMRKICKMHRCWLDSISKTTSANMHSFVLFPPFLIFILIPSLLFWLQFPSPSSLCYRFLRYGGIRFTWWLPYALQHHETRECWPTVQAYHINQTFNLYVMCIQYVMVHQAHHFHLVSQTMYLTHSHQLPSIFQGQLHFTVYFTKNYYIYLVEKVGNVLF